MMPARRKLPVVGDGALAGNGNDIASMKYHFMKPVVVFND